MWIMILLKLYYMQKMITLRMYYRKTEKKFRCVTGRQVSVYRNCITDRKTDENKHFIICRYKIMLKLHYMQTYLLTYLLTYLMEPEGSLPRS